MLLSRNFSDVAQEINTTFRKGTDVHAELRRVVGRHGGCQVAGSDDVLDFRMAFRKVSNEVHFFPAVFFLALDARKPKTFERIAVHKVEGSIFIEKNILTGFS